MKAPNKIINRVAEVEIWKPIFGYEGLYEVSNLGNVKSLERKTFRTLTGWSTQKERILKSCPNPRGYLTVQLSKNGVGKTRVIYRLVAEAFLNHFSKGYSLVVNHIDLNKKNNRLDNLELISQRENANHKHLKAGRSSIYTGVCLIKATNKWKATIHVNGKNRHLGFYNFEIDAHEKYQEALALITQKEAV